MSTTAPVRSHAAVQGNIINSSFNGAQCDHYSLSHCHPSCCSLQQQQLDVRHRWASALPWNEIGLCVCIHVCCIYCSCMCVRCTTVAGEDDDRVWYILVGYIWQSPGDKSVWFHISVCQTEGRSAVWLCLSLATPLKDNNDNIDAFCKLSWFPVYIHAVSIVGEIRACFLLLRRNWCCFMLLLLQFSYFFISQTSHWTRC